MDKDKKAHIYQIKTIDDIYKYADELIMRANELL
jgi:hypothetical protein